MDILNSELEQYKDKIPEFIIKLYHILEQKQFNQYLCWNGDHQILIKSGKKLEEKVLPHFFRHRHLSSFIRQLNMYKFNKVAKLTKEKNFMYFKNDNFCRGNLKLLLKIKRNIKKNKKENEQIQMNEENPEDSSDLERSDNISIDKDLEINDTTLLRYKGEVKTSIFQITEILKILEAKFPEAKTQVTNALNICNQLLEATTPVSSPAHFSYHNFEESYQNKNMLSTLKLIPRLQSLVFPSQISFCQFNNN